MIISALSLVLVLAEGLQVSVQPPPQPPRRDIVVPQKGTAVIKGRVIAADTERPLRRARVRVSAPELSEAKTASTNTDGAYEVRDLPAGRFTIQVSRGGYLPLQHGERRPGEPGKPLQLADATVSLNQYIRGPAASMSSGVSGTRIAADGTWTIRNVAPGEYELEVSSTDRERGTERATMPLFVQGADVEGIALVTGAAGTLSGQIVTDDGQPLPPSVTRLRVVPDPVTPDRQPPMLVMGDDNGLVGADGGFTFKGVSGPSMVRIWSLPSGWAVKSIDIGGADYAQTPLDVRGGQQIAGARIVLTKRFPAVAGRITDDKGQPSEGTVLLFPSDPSKWFAAADTLRSVRPDQSGNYRIPTVRPGQYLAIALDYVQAWQLNDPEFLEELRDRATKLVVGEETIEDLILTVRK